MIDMCTAATSPLTGLGDNGSTSLETILVLITKTGLEDDM